MATLSRPTGGLTANRQAFVGGSRAARGRVALAIPHATALPAEVKTVAPLGHRVFVKAVEPEEITSGGILLPTSAQKRPTQGEIINAGNAKALKKGDRVVYSKYAGTEVEMQSTNYIILKEDDVIGLLAGDDITALAPCQDRLLVEQQAASDRTAGGLLLTEGSQEKPTVGRVVAVGPGKVKGDDETATAPAIAPGASVLYSKYSGTEFEGSDGKKYIVIREADILATLE